nr:NADH-plastoquinone oxidoreductase subunit 7 [Zygophyllum kansuense]UJH21916.1 NADH-plastoquinone oxidoreductase subunit 7 [Zygophyllum kansuense]
MYQQKDFMIMNRAAHHLSMRSVL